MPLSLLPQRFQGIGACVVQPGADGNVYLATVSFDPWLEKILSFQSFFDSDDSCIHLGQGVRNELAQYNPRNGKFQFFTNTGGTAGNLQPFNDAWPAKTGVSNGIP